MFEEQPPREVPAPPDVERGKPLHDSPADDVDPALVLEAASPGVPLADLLARFEPADADDATLLEAVAGWDRLAAWGAAKQAAVISELHRRREAKRCGEFTADELAARRACTRHAAQTALGLALGLERLPAVADALGRGDIDARKALVVTEDLMHVPASAAAAAADAVLVDAPHLTAPQLKARLRRLEIERDPDGAGRRHERARAERHVELTPSNDAMAWLSAYLPADDAVAVYTSLTAIADSADPADDRPIGARRADALVDLATRWLDAGTTPDGPLTVRQGRRPHLSLTASASTLLALDDAPSELAGYGPIPAPMARRIAARSTWSPLLVDARNGAPLARSTRRYEPTPTLRRTIADRDVTCVFPGCRQRAERCDLDHIVPFERRTSESTDQTREANLHALCRHHHRAKTHAGWSVRRDDDRGSTHWRAPTGHLYVRPPATSPPPRIAGPPSPDIPIDLAPPREPDDPLPGSHGHRGATDPFGDPPF